MRRDVLGRKKLHLDISRLFTVPYFFVRQFRYTASFRHGYLDFQMYRGGGSWGLQPQGVGGSFDTHVSRFLPNRPRPLSSFDTHARWQPVTQSARSRRSYGKIEDCEQSKILVYRLTSQLNLQRVIFPNSNLGFYPKLSLENLSPLL